MRKYIRHPSDIPIEFDISNYPEEKQRLNNVSLGGVSFQTKSKIDIGTIISLCIPVVKPAFKAQGRVAWCRKSGNNFDVGVELLEKEEAFRTRMIEQICHIEHYKNEVYKTEGRELSGEEAALEWINKFAHTFPDFDLEDTSQSG